MKVMMFSHMNRMAVTALSALALCLSSCHTTLYNAAALGDVETVRRELAAGANPNKSASKANLIWQIPSALVTVPVDVAQVGLFIGTLGLYGILVGWDEKVYFASDPVFDFGKKPPAEVAYERGHTAVLDELAKAGTIVAPDNVLYKKLILQPEQYTVCDSSDGFDFGCVGSFDVPFDSYWPANRAFSRSGGEVRVHSWKDANPVDIKAKIIKHVYGVPIYEGDGENLYEHYRRQTVDSAEVVYRNSLGMGSSWIYGNVYLKFDSPSSGTYREVTTCVSDDPCATMGRFWLKDVPAVDDSASKIAKPSAKKRKSKKRR